MGTNTTEQSGAGANTPGDDDDDISSETYMTCFYQSGRLGLAVFDRSLQEVRIW